MAARITPEYQQSEAHRECARGLLCFARTRDAEGQWHPARAAQPVCPADQDVMTTYLGELPGMYERLTERLTDPVRRARPVRVTPGSRVLVSGDADELMHDMADWLGAWAVRVRAIPQLSLSLPEARYGTQERIEADCNVLAAFPGPVLALDLKDALRTWTFPPPRAASDPPSPVFRLRRPHRAGGLPRPVPCRRCRLLLAPSPSGRYWWPAQCTHAAPLLPAGERDDDARDARLLCSACGIRVPHGWQAPPTCRHEPAGEPWRASPIPAAIEVQIEHLEVIRAGDGWVQCLTPYGGREAALDVFELRDRAMRLLKENPAPPDLLDGVPCGRLSCEANGGTLEALPAVQPDDQREGEPDFSRCTRCGDRMTRTEYDQHVRRYESWAKEAIQSCRRCARGACGECQWKACSCRAAGHKVVA
jgi:hypothetical protein